MKKFLLYFSLLLSFVSCEKKIEWPLKSKNTNIIVVDGTITDEKKQHIITLTYSVEQLNQTPAPISNASVTIYEGITPFPLAEQPANSGIYKTDSNFQGQPGNEYSLSIIYNNTVYAAQTIMLPGQQFNQLQYAKDDNDGLYHITFVANPFNAQYFAMYEILLDWSNVQGYQNVNPDSCKARLLYYTLPTIDVSEVLAPDAQNISFPLGTLITERRYSMTREQAEFIRALLSETNWQGGLFDSAHSNVPTNLNNGAVGFFAACGVASLFLTVGN